MFDTDGIVLDETDSATRSGRIEDAAYETERLGYAVLPGAANDVPLVAAFDALVVGSRSGSQRVSPASELIQQLADEPLVRRLITQLVGSAGRPVRAIAFDKTQNANWLVPWHQDRTIAVDQRDENAPVSNWTVKRGVVHCEPPVHMLERMLTLRWHFDGIGLADGCIRVVPGTHLLGRLTRADIAAHVARQSDRSIPVPAGGLFAMRPLLVHSSRRRTTAGRRRVLHVEFAAGDPPFPLKWAPT